MEKSLVRLAYIDDVDPTLWLLLHGLGALLVAIISIYSYYRGNPKIAILGVIGLLNPFTELLQYLDSAPFLIKEYLSDVSFVCFWMLIVMALPIVIGKRSPEYLKWAAVGAYLFAVQYEVLQFGVGVGTLEDISAYSVGLVLALLLAWPKRETKLFREIEIEGGMP